MTKGRDDNVAVVGILGFLRNDSRQRLVTTFSHDLQFTEINFPFSEKKSFFNWKEQKLLGGKFSDEEHEKLFKRVRERSKAFFRVEFKLNLSSKIRNVPA